MPYIVKSSLDIGGKIVPWNEKETNKLIKEKEEFFNKKQKIEIVEEVEEKEIKEFEEIKENETDMKKQKTEAKKIQKVGEK